MERSGKRKENATGPLEERNGCRVRWSGGQVGWLELVAASQEPGGRWLTPTSGRGPCAGSGSWSPRGCTCRTRSGSSPRAGGRSCRHAGHRHAWKRRSATSVWNHIIEDSPKFLAILKTIGKSLHVSKASLQWQPNVSVFILKLIEMIIYWYKFELLWLIKSARMCKLQSTSKF